MRFIELRRHTQNDGDRLTEEGLSLAHEIARTGLTPPYSAFLSTGTWRAGEMLTILRKATKQEALPIVDEPELRSRHERRWREAAKQCGENATIADIRQVDPELVENDIVAISLAIRTILPRIPEGGRALIIGHGFSNEAAVYGLTGQVIAPLGFGEGVLISEHDRTFAVSRLPELDRVGSA